MKPHKHAELIKQWADGAEIEARVIGMGYAWQPLLNPRWDDKDIVEYRIKPEPKPDVVTYFYVSKDDISYTDESGANLIVIIDGQTNLPKSTMG